MARFVSLLGALGGVMLGFGLLAQLLAFFQPLMDLRWVWGNLALGLLLVVVWVSWRFDELRSRMQSGGGRRSGIQGTSALVQVAAGLAILGMLGFLSTRYSTRWDWTREGINTLSEQSLSLLEGLDRDVVVTAFFRELEIPAVRDLLERYERGSERLRLRFADPNRRPDLVEAHGLVPDELARGVILVEAGDESVKVAQFDEASITNALVKLTRRGERVVYFVEGHNERKSGGPAPPGGQDAPEPGEEGETAAGREGYAQAADALRNETFRVERLMLPSAGEIPADADAVVIAGPTRPFFEHERAALEAFLARGGGLVVFVDPRARTNLYPDLERWGALVGDDVIVDRAQSLFGQATTPLSGPVAEEHPIGSALGGPALFRMARSVQAVPGSGLEVVVSTGQASWAERDLEQWMKSGRATLDDADLVGPVPIVVAGRPRLGAEAADDASDADAAARLVVVGDSNFASNEFLEAGGNRDLFLNAVSWAIGDVESIAVRPNVARASTVQLTAQQFQRIQYLSLFVLPEAIALVGVAAWWSRRRGRARAAS